MAAGTGCTDDGDICTDDECDGGGLCDHPEDPTNDPICAVAACALSPLSSCVLPEKAALQYSEKKVGKEKMKMQWKKLTTATTQAAFGNPVTGDATVALCIYDDADVLVEEFLIHQAGATCAGKPCWKAVSTAGYGYKDKDNAADGISKLGYKAGDAGKGKGDAKGKNNSSKSQLSLPVGVVPLLAGNIAPTIQMVTSEGLCLSATMTEVTTDNGLQYKAKK